MQVFESGATRDSSDDKVNYVGLFSPSVLKSYAEYLHGHRLQADGKMRASDNWKSGIPIQKYAESLVRHMMDVWLTHDGQTCVDIRDGHVVTIDEALCAVIFNAMGYLFELQKANVCKFNPIESECNNAYLAGDCSPLQDAIDDCYQDIPSGERLSQTRNPANWSE